MPFALLQRYKRCKGAKGRLKGIRTEGIEVYIEGIEVLL